MMSIFRYTLRGIFGAQPSGRLLGAWIGMNAVGPAVFAMRCIPKLLAAHDYEPWSRIIFVCLTVSGLVLSWAPLVLLYWKKHLFPPPRYGGSALLRQPIVEAPRDPLIVVVLEGRVAQPATREQLTAPLSGGPCVHYRVFVEQ